ncbi:MAG: TIGR04282 family arsenosugar biosynthesis glycosyltransferase [Thermodesulfovibrionales bacterium]
MNNKNLYGIMIKYPEPGRVKTRLARDLGPEKAALICRQLTERVMEQTVPVIGEYHRSVFYDPPERRQDFVSWLPNENFTAQKGSNIGERMDNAIRYLLENGAEKAVITGADIPDLANGIIMQALKMLDHADVAVGPARDGGYYLIGLKSPMPELFRNIHWSTGDVFAETVSILKRSGKSFGVLPVLSDLDTIEDLAQIII